MLFLNIIGEWLSGMIMLAGYVTGSFPKPLTAEEEAEYLRRFKAGDAEAKNTLIERNLRLCAHIAKKYGDERTMEDYISIGTIGLIKAVNTFDTDKAGRLSTYAARCIENEILMYIRASKKRQNEISMDETIGTDREGNSMTFADILPCGGEDIADSVWSRIESAKLYEAIKTALTPVEADIIAKRYGLNAGGRKTQKEIAAELGISRSYVSRIEKRCIKKLSDFMRTDE